MDLLSNNPPFMIYSHGRSLEYSPHYELPSLDISVPIGDMFPFGSCPQWISSTPWTAVPIRNFFPLHTYYE